MHNILIKRTLGYSCMISTITKYSLYKSYIQIKKEYTNIKTSLLHIQTLQGIEQNYQINFWEREREKKTF